MKRLLCVFLLLAMTAALCACADNGDTPPEVTTAAVPADTQPQETDSAVVTEITHDLPAGLDFEQRIVNIASSDRSWWIDEVTVDNITGDVIDDSIYNRNLAVESLLNVKINNIKIPYADSNSSTVNAVKTSVLAGSPDYDVVFANAFVSLSNSTSAIYHDLYDIDYIDLSKPYWSQGVNEAVEFHGAQFAATGSIALSTMRFAFATLFNKSLFDVNGVDYLYGAVTDGKWTLEYQHNILKNIYEDKNGSNTADAEDIYGWITNDYIGSDPYWVSCEVPILGRDGNGDYTYVLDTDKLSSLVDKLLTMYEDPGTFHVAHKAADAEQDDMVKMFSEGHGAMTTLRLIETESDAIRKMEDKYGVVPMPKYDEAQEKYHTLIHDQFTVVSVTTTVKEDDFEVMGALLEAMAAESHKTVMPAYYETTLKYKYSSDPESWEMLDIVIENITMDAGIIYTSSLSNVHHKLRSILATRSNTVASNFKSMSKILTKLLDNFNVQLTKLADK